MPLQRRHINHPGAIKAGTEQPPRLLPVSTVVGEDALANERHNPGTAIGRDAPGLEIGLVNGLQDVGIDGEDDLLAENVQEAGVSPEGLEMLAGEGEPRVFLDVPGALEEEVDAQDGIPPRRAYHGLAAMSLPLAPESHRGSHTPEEAIENIASHEKKCSGAG